MRCAAKRCARLRITLSLVGAREQGRRLGEALIATTKGRAAVCSSAMPHGVDQVRSSRCGSSPWKHARAPPTVCAAIRILSRDATKPSGNLVHTVRVVVDPVPQLPRTESPTPF
jgi:hypothetical protein